MDSERAAQLSHVMYSFPYLSCALEDVSSLRAWSYPCHGPVACFAPPF